MEKTKKIYLLFAAIFVLVSVKALFSGPVVIRDNRVRDLGVTPVLGRGYSLATNTFQSTCLTNIKLTEPSYDMTYTFQSLDSVRDITGVTSSIDSVLYTEAFKEYLELEDMKKAEEAGINQGSPAEVGSDFKVNVTKKRIMVTIDLHSYYASIDESQSKMSETSQKLLKNKDYPGFFHSCGSYYIRSIGRKARFISLFKFESISKEEDKSFIYQLESEIKGFRKKLVVDGKETISETRQSKIEEKTESFNEIASQVNLTITSAAFGLGKNEKASLLSYDIDSFKNAIKDAFISMQNPRTGKVSSIEVIPWVENTQFQSIINLEESTPVYEEYKDEQGNVKKRKKTMLLYEKKHIMNLNAEFLSEVERSDRNKLNIFYKAKLCKEQIDGNWKRGGRVFKSRAGLSYGDRWVRNNKGDIATVKLGELDQALSSNNKIESLYKDREKFMNSARPCMNTMIKNIFTIPYRDIAPCRALQKQMGQIEEEIIDNHCMPSLHDRNYDPSKVK